MRRIGLIVAAAAAFGVVPASAAGCNLGAVRPWMAAKPQPYMSEAYSNGARCSGAVVTIVVRGPDGKVLWTESRASEHVMPFVDANTVPKMNAALRDWLEQTHPFKSTGDLPAWKKGADAPNMLGEFPFYPEADVDQVTYEQIRAQRQNIFCYVQGMESMACIAIAKDGAARKVGVQSFPG